MESWRLDELAGNDDGDDYPLVNEEMDDEVGLIFYALQCLKPVRFKFAAGDRLQNAFVTSLHQILPIDRCNTVLQIK